MGKHHQPAAPPPQQGLDYNAGPGPELLDSQNEFAMGAPPTSAAGAGFTTRTKGGLAARHGDTELTSYSKRRIVLEHIAKANDPDASPLSGSMADGSAGAAVGALIGGVPGAALGYLATGFEFKFGKDYYTLASLPGHAMDFIEENTGIPLEGMLASTKNLAWTMSEQIYPEFTAMVSFIMNILLDNFEDPTFTKVVPAEHWWQEDKEVGLQRFEVFASAADRSAETVTSTMDKEARHKFYDALNHVGAQLGGAPGKSGGLVALNNPTSALAQQMELATLGALVGNVLQDHRYDIDSGGKLSNFRMNIRNEDGKIETITRDIELTNRDDVIDLVRSRFLDSKYEQLKNTHEGHQQAAGAAIDPQKDAVEAETRKSASGHIAKLFALAGITEKQFLDLIGYDKEVYKVEVNDSIAPGQEHVQLVYRDTDGNEHRTALFDEMNSDKLKHTLRQLETVRNIHDLEGIGEGLTQEELLRGIDVSNVQITRKDQPPITIDEANPGLRLNPETLLISANFTDGERHSFDLNDKGVMKLKEKLHSREMLATLEHEIASEKNQTLQQAMAGAVAAAISGHFPGTKLVTSDGKLSARPEGAIMESPKRLDQVVPPNVVAEAKKNAEIVMAYGHGVEKGAKVGEPGKKEALQDAPKPSKERDGGTSSSSGGSTGKTVSPSDAFSAAMAEAKDSISLEDVHHTPEDASRSGRLPAPGKPEKSDAEKHAEKDKDGEDKGSRTR